MRSLQSFNKKCKRVYKTNRNNTNKKVKLNDEEASMINNLAQITFNSGKKLPQRDPYRSRLFRFIKLDFLAQNSSFITQNTEESEVEVGLFYVRGWFIGYTNCSETTSKHSSQYYVS